MVDPEIGFTSDVIRDPNRFVGRRELIRDCIKALNSPLGLVAVYGKRGVGKSSLLRQIQQMALGDYTLAEQAGLQQEIPKRPRQYLTVYYTCDSMIADGPGLLARLCNDQSEEDGLLRLVPDDGKILTEFTRSKEINVGADLKVVNWGTKGIESTKYARTVPNDIVQTFRNYASAVVSHQVKKRMGRDSLLILLDEFDVLKDKGGLGSLIKSLTSAELKFGVCGIGHDLMDLITDHASVDRLLEQGAVHVHPMSEAESLGIITKAEELFQGTIKFDQDVANQIVQVSDGYPYFTQLLGKECVSKANAFGTKIIGPGVYRAVLEDIKNGRSFPTLE